MERDTKALKLLSVYRNEESFEKTRESQNPHPSRSFLPHLLPLVKQPSPHSQGIHLLPQLVHRS